jgi:uncharacterized protein (DUF1800 family)
MQQRVLQVDPAWAWEAWEPTAEQSWTRREAAHLYRRAGFAARSADLDRATTQSPAELVNELVFGSAGSPAAAGEIDELAQASLAAGNPRRLSAWWLYRMATSDRPLREKMTLFWHGHFATSAEKVADAKLMYGQNELLRRHALGNFGTLLHEISRDPAMLVYLDSATNRKAHPNENYAREIMELFALGEGAYREQDIRELARCFTGWEIRRGAYRFNRYQHDAGEKTILGQTGAFAGDDGVDIVLAQRAAPRFLVRKLIRYFVCDEPAAGDDLVEPLADQLRADGLELAPTIARILSSRLFFSPESMGCKVRSPVELGVGLLRAFEGTTNFLELARRLAECGQELFYPPNVKGWDGGRTWINSSTLLARTNLIGELLSSDKTRFGGDSLETYLAAHAPAGGEAVVDWLAELLLARPLPEPVRLQLQAQWEKAPADRGQSWRELVFSLCALPEMQLS